MLSHSRRINTYLALLMACLLAGCATKGGKGSLNRKGKERSVINLHIEEPLDGTDRNGPVSIHRTVPLVVSLHKVPFLDEGNLEKAEVVEEIGGFAIRLVFDRRGKWLLENVTAANRGRHIGIFSVFGDTPEQTRWLAAPVIQARIADGVLTFTPDASRAEAERIVLGLNQVVAEVAKKQWFKDSPQ